MRNIILRLIKPVALTTVVLSTVAGYTGVRNTHTVWPTVIDNVLYNPGIGFQTTRYYNPGVLPGFPKTSNELAFDGDSAGYPPSRVAVAGWYWREIEPEEGKYRWDIIDNHIAEARLRGQRVAFRVMPSNGSSGAPDWYRKLGTDGFEYTPEASRLTGSDVKNWMPDHNDPLYLKYMGQLVKEMGERYDGHPDVDHVGIRSLGHWGEWHFSFIEPRPVVKPEIRKALVDIYLDNFKKTPLVIPIGAEEQLTYAVNQGVGWRADCLGDLGIWGDQWSHHRDYYQQAIDKSDAGDAWKTAPVIFEACGTMQTWVDLGFDVDFIFNEALRWHCTQFHGKATQVPPGYWGIVNKFLRRIGYRFVLRYLTHNIEAKPGSVFKIESEWENVGVAPPYRNYIIAFELRPLAVDKWYNRVLPENAIRYECDVDLRKWLPGKHDLEVNWQLPTDLAPGRYELALGVLDPFSRKAEVQLAIEGVDRQNWYNLSEINIVE
ncbi:DUF4832 domain-containing protein [candidate division KSB1 bacterium]